MPKKLLLNTGILFTMLLLLLNNKSMAQEGWLNDNFATGNTYNWVSATSGASLVPANGQLVMTMAPASGGKYRADFRKEGGAVFHAGNYPIVAIRFNKPPRCNFFFDTNLGSYNGTNNNAVKLVTDSGNIYYWDLSTGKLGTTTLSTTASTAVSLFQFKVADIVLTQAELAASDFSFEIAWVKTFTSVDALRAYAGMVSPPAFEFTGAFTHPGLLHSTADLARIKGFVTNQVARPFESYKLLAANSKASASYTKGGPFTYLTRDASLTIDGVGGGAVKDRVESDFLAAYYNALMWNITGNQAHAAKAIEIIDAYAAKTLGIIGADAELNGLYGFILANAAEIMRYTYAGWPADKIAQCQSMLQSVFYPTLQNFRPCAHGNWDIICMKALMAIAVFSDDKPMFNKVVNYFYYGEGNGSINNYVLTAAGQLQESNRDQPHTMLALGSLAELAEVALKQGIDLYNASTNAIMRGFEYTSKYNLGYTVPFQTSYEYCEKNYQDYTPEAISPNGRGNLRAVFEIAYNHYAYRKGLALPYTLEVLSVMGPEGAPFGADNPGYGSLLFYLSDSANHRFDTTGNYLKGLVNDNFTTGNDGWVAATSGATAVAQNGLLTVTPALQSNGSRRGDIRRNGGASLYPKNYPIVAIKMKKPATCNVTFDTNLGSFGNGSNKWTGKVGEDIYYYDLSKTGFGAGAVFLSTSFPTALTTFQFKIADITSGETSFGVDWVKTVKSVSDLLAMEPTTGLINDNFNGTTDGWVAATTGSTVTADSTQLKVTLALQSGGKYRGDIRKSAGATLYPGNYPIVAIKFKKPAVGNIIFDTNLGSYGNGSNKWTGKVGADVYYYDLTKTGFGAGNTILTQPAALTTFQFKVADITSGETGYEVDWIKTVKTLADLCNYANPPITVTIPDVYAMNPAVDLKNTIYIGYGPSSLTITAQPSGGTAPYAYTWTTSQTASSIVVDAAGSYGVTVTDAMGCQTVDSIQINTVNVQCGNANNKVQICHNGNNICVASDAVPAHLDHGDNLGGCAVPEKAIPQQGTITEESMIANTVIYPNPVRGSLFYIRTARDLLNKEVFVNITDLGGRIVFKKLVKKNSGNIEVQLNKPLAGGIYLVRMNNNVATKLVVAK
ncbi:DUF4979 domain-containing protein [Pseudoflavitalea sp. X16]|uniref:DUF4979 domain-containing protein n=1 Tax=Paraflavitalea devenefica TaxID=2716334 RepID=UPI00141E4EDC|nr:DUF4979 domain-containing protein [Paraflavitalea devenefica]NII29816.1 DUF4979 domain-containing protein [Paraflavitalea devenefica]